MMHQSQHTAPRSCQHKQIRLSSTTHFPSASRHFRCKSTSQNISNESCSSSSASPVAKIPRTPRLAASLLLSLVLPAAAQASEELSAQNADSLASFFTYVESQGPAGCVAFILLVMTLEMVPLLPTQPLSLASGLLFGPLTGGLVMLTGMSLAANNAFWISRGVGRKLAQSIISMETTDDEESSDDLTVKKPSAVALKIKEVEAAIEAGGPLQQLLAVLFLRLTPVVPFSASNYVLGLSPVLYSSYIAGTVIGMSGWSLLYASLGAGARSLLDSGVDIPTLFADLAEKAGGYSSTALKVTLGMGIVAGAVLVSKKGKQGEAS